MSNKSKGNLLEEIIESLCSDYENSKVKRNAKVVGKSGVEREIDVLIEAKHKSFDIKVIVEAKNYSSKVDIGIIESFKTKLNDVGGNLGVIVCPNGFTDGAKKSAEINDIQLYQVVDDKLKNVKNFIPLRYIIPEIESYQIGISHGDSSGGTFILPIGVSKWRIHLGGKIMDKDALIAHIWNNKLLPNKGGEHKVDLGVVKISTQDNPDKFFYVEMCVRVIVREYFYLKMFPESYMKNMFSGKGNHRLKVDIYSKKEDMIKNGWKSFDTRETMENEAKKFETSPDVRGLTIVHGYYFSEEPQ